MNKQTLVAVGLLLFIASSGADAKIEKIQSSTAVGLSNGHVRIEFSRKSGELVSLINLDANENYLKHDGWGGNPFRVYVNTNQLPKELTTGDSVQGEHGDLGGYVIDPVKCKLIDYSFKKQGQSEQLLLKSANGAKGLEFLLSATLDEKEPVIVLDLKIRNGGQESVDLLTALPYLTGIGLGPDRKTNLAVRLRDFGQSRAPAWENQGDVYGRGWNGQWDAVYEPSNKAAMGIIVKDSKPSNKIIRRFKPSGMSVLYFDKAQLAPGKEMHYPAAEIIVNSGSWKYTARRYRQWYQENMNPRLAPDWVKDVDMYIGMWIPHPDTIKQNKSQGKGFTSFAQLGNLYSVPDNSWDFSGDFDLKEWAFYWQSVVDDTNQYTSYNHTTGVYEPRMDLGGMAALRAGVDGVHRIGRYAGFYLAAHTIKKTSPMLEGKPEVWFGMDQPGQKVPDGPSIWACTGYGPWQDHMAEVCQTLLKETGVDYIRLDEFSGPFAPCHNPAHGHSSPYNAIEWNLEFLRKIRQAMDQVNPNALLFTEFSSELNHKYTNGGLNMWSAGVDIAPVRLSVPSMLAFSYHTGQVESALNGFVSPNHYACSRGGAWYNKHHDTAYGPGLERKPKCYTFTLDSKSYYESDDMWKWGGNKINWNLMAHMFYETVSKLDPADVNPEAIGMDPEEWAGRLWRGENYWVFVGGSRAANDCSGPVKWKLSELPGEVKTAVEFDCITCKMKPAKLEKTGNGTFIETSSGFSAVLLPKPGCKAVIAADENDFVQAKAGDIYQAKLGVYCPWGNEKTRRVTVNMPGVAGEIKMQLPGQLKFAIPADTAPGVYQVKIEGDVLPFKRWVRIVAAE